MTSSALAQANESNESVALVVALFETHAGQTCAYLYLNANISTSRTMLNTFLESWQEFVDQSAEANEKARFESAPGLR